MVSKEPNELERFSRWFVVPYKKLKEISDGDGAFLALSMGLFLCERYYKYEAKIQDEEGTSKDDLFRNKAAKDLNVNTTFFCHFWQVYRNGMQHQASPKTYKIGKITYKWSFDTEYEAHPMYFDKDGFRIICLNPWKFTDFMIQKILTKPACLKESMIYELGRIREKDPAFKPKRVIFSQNYP
jgi:hypothetical protein